MALLFLNKTKQRYVAAGDIHYITLLATFRAENETAELVLPLVVSFHWRFVFRQREVKILPTADRKSARVVHERLQLRFFAFLSLSITTKPYLDRSRPSRRQLCKMAV